MILDGLEDRGIRADDERALRRTVDLLALARPNLLTDACRTCLAGEVRVRQDEEIPEIYYGPPNLEGSRNSIYGVFPHDLNKEELAFARMLDTDETGTVLWWLRNVSMATWAVSIVLPSGKRHFPDFVVGVDPRRRSQDHIALVEVKDDGTTGRLWSERNAEKVRTDHSIYRSCLMVYRDGQSLEWYHVVYRPEIQRHAAGGRFVIEDLVRTA